MKSYDSVLARYLLHVYEYMETSGNGYCFPMEKLMPLINDEGKQPLVLVACGSFSPITFLHLRMFEMAKDRIQESPRYYIIGGYFSPTSDAYGKAGLAPWKDRVNMCNLATDRSEWIMVDEWEASQDQWQRTVVVLDHFNYYLNILPRQNDPSRPLIRIMLLAGGDLIESFGTPNLWSFEDLERIVGDYGCLIVERTGVDIKAFLLSHDILYKHRSNIMICKQYIYNDINSTKIRLFVRRGMSIKYLLPDSVIEYIYKKNLYHGIDPTSLTLPLTLKDAMP